MNDEINIVSDLNFFDLFAISIKAMTTVLCIQMLYISDYGFIFFATAMIPSVIAHFVDTKQCKYNSSAICAFNFAGVTPYLLEIWSVNATDAGVKLIIGNFKTWIVIYSSAAFGQLIIWIIEFITIRVMILMSNIKVNYFNSEIYRISKEWSIE